jgi:hypothetical protein
LSADALECRTGSLRMDGVQVPNKSTCSNLVARFNQFERI